jgi:hypothetical protein
VVIPTEFYFFVKTNSPSFAVTLILSPGLNSPSSNFLESGLSKCSCTARLSGRAQREGGTVEEIRPGDVAWFAPGEKHWHGASPTTAMTHLAIQEQLDGKAVDWLEKVSDAQYQN